MRYDVKWVKPPRRPYKRWTDTEEKVLAEMVANGRPHAEIAELLGRTTRAVSVHASKVGAVRRPYRQWTTGERSRLRDLADGTRTSKQVAAEMGRSVNSVEGMAWIMGVSFKRDRPRLGRRAS